MTERAQEVQEGGRPCPHCGGKGEVTGNVDDVVFILPCVCAGGSEEAVRWLLGPEWPGPPGDDWSV